jgi:hypothetical protein
LVERQAEQPIKEALHLEFLALGRIARAHRLEPSDELPIVLACATI